MKTIRNGEASQAPRYGALGFTALALVLAIMTGWLALRIVKAGGYANEATRPVVVAARTLQAGKPLGDADLKLVQWPVSSMPAGAFADKALLLGAQPRVPNAGFVEGEPILVDRLASPQAGPGLAALVSPEHRAVAIRLDRELAAARLVYPGARVDVLVTLRGLTRTVLEDVRVLAVGVNADIDAMRRGVRPTQSGNIMGMNAETVDAIVTLEVSPADAERVSLAAREGKVDLTLRNASDRSEGMAEGTTILEFFRGVSEQQQQGAAAASANKFLPTPAPVLSRRMPKPRPLSNKKMSRPSEVEAPVEQEAIRVQ